MMTNNAAEYKKSQDALVSLKTAIYDLLARHNQGLSNAQIGRSLGIYEGHEGHEGHISRTLLAMMEAEGVVSQDPQSKKWSIRGHS